MHSAPPIDDLLSKLPPNLVRNLMAAADPAFAMSMWRYTAAAAILIAGKPGRDMTAPEPIVQAGFEATPEVIELMVAKAPAEGRDLIHIAIHPTGSGTPVGMIAVVYLDGGRALAHRVSSLIRDPASSKVILAGVADEDDQRYHFVLRPGEKMIRLPGCPVEDLRTGLDQAAALWHDLAHSPALQDCRGETIRQYASVKAARESTGHEAKG